MEKKPYCKKMPHHTLSGKNNDPHSDLKQKKVSLPHLFLKKLA